MGDAPIRPRYATVEYGTPGGDLSLYLSRRPIRCGIVGYNQRRAAPLRPFSRQAR